MAFDCSVSFSAGMCGEDGQPLGRHTGQPWEAFSVLRSELQQVLNSHRCAQRLSPCSS